MLLSSNQFFLISVPMKDWFIDSLNKLLYLNNVWEILSEIVKVKSPSFYIYIYNDDIAKNFIPYSYIFLHIK